MRGISWFVHILRDRSKLLLLKLTKVSPNENFSGKNDSGKVLIIIIKLFLNIIIIIIGTNMLLPAVSMDVQIYMYLLCSEQFFVLQGC